MGWQTEHGLADPQRWLAPGQEVAVFPQRDGLEQMARVRKALVLGIHDGDLVISHPEPPLQEPVLGQALSITFVAHTGAEKERLGFFSLVLDTLDEYADSKTGLPALVVIFPGQRDLSPSNLRKIARHPVPKDSPITLLVEGLKQVRLVDISRKGLRFVCREPGQIAIGSSLAMSLDLHDRAYEINGVVVGAYEKQEGVQVSVSMEALPLNIWTGLLPAFAGPETGGNDTEDKAP